MGFFRDDETIIQIDHNMFKNPNWPEANQLAIYKRGRGFEHRTAVNKSNKRSERDLNSGPPNYKSSALTTRPCCRLKVSGPLQGNVPCKGTQLQAQSWILDFTQWIVDSRYWIPDSLLVELSFRSLMVSYIGRNGRVISGRRRYFNYTKQDVNYSVTMRKSSSRHRLPSGRKIRYLSYAVLKRF